VGYVFQNPEHQFVSDTVQDELAFSLAPRGRGRPGRLTGAQRQLVDDWLDRLELLHLARANPFSLSQGQKRRLSVAAMLIRGCPFLILDEPTLGQDEALAARLMEMMREFQAEGGTVAMITHDMGIVAEYASRVLVLAAGRVLFCGDPVRLFAMPAVVEEAGLAMPAVAQVALELLAGVGTRARLLTVADFLNAAGEANG
jgi:energy-coupling factor transport system ATP-binding protein